MKRAAAAVAVLAGLLAASPAAARPAATGAAPVDPSKQVLQKADFPAGATYEAELGLDGYLRTPLKAAGLSGQAGRYLGASYSKSKGFLQVSGVVITLADAAAARTAFAIVKRARVKLLRTAAGDDDWRPLTLPRFGDEQTARISPPGNEGIGQVELLVRKQRVVWLLFLHLERRPKPPVAELTADTRAYAARQQRRVGAGS